VPMNAELLNAACPGGLRLGPLIENPDPGPEALPWIGPTAYAPADSRLPSSLCPFLSSLFSSPWISAGILRPCLLWLELRHRLRPASALAVSPSPMVRDTGASEALVEGLVRNHNPHARMEVMVAGAACSSPPAGTRQPRRAAAPTEVLAVASDEKARPDGYWAAYIARKKNHPGQGCASTSKAPAGANAARNQISRPARHLWLENPLDQLRPLRPPATPRWCAGPAAQPEPLDPGTPWRQGEGCSVFAGARTHLPSGGSTIQRGLAPYAGGVAPGRGHPHHR